MKLLLYCLLSVISLGSMAQSKVHFSSFAYDIGNILLPQNVEIRFDSNGKITSPLPTLFRKKDRISLSFSPNRKLVPEELYSSILSKKLSAFYNMYVAADNFKAKNTVIQSYFKLLLALDQLKKICPDPSAEVIKYGKVAESLRQNIKDENSIYSAWILHFLGCNEFKTALAFYTRVKDYGDSLQVSIAASKKGSPGEKASEKLQIQKDSLDLFTKSFDEEKIDTACITHYCICQKLTNLVTEIKAKEKMLTEIANRQRFVQNLYCDSLDTRSAPGDLASVPPVKNAFVGKFMPLLSTHSYTTSPVQIKNKIGDSLNPDADSLSIALTVENINQRKILEWHNDAIMWLDRKELGKIQKQAADITFLNKTVTKYLSSLTEKKPVCADIPRLRFWLNAYSKFDCYLTPTSSIGLWLKRWLWYGGGDISLNYFNITSEDSIDAVADKERKSFAKKQDSLDYADYKRLIDTNILLLPRQDSLFPRINEYQKLRKEAEDKFGYLDQIKRKKKQLQDNLIEFTTVVTPVHKIQVPLSGARQNHFILFHDRSHYYRRLITQDVVLPASFTPSFGIINAPDADKINITQSLNSFDDIGRFRIEGKAVMAELQAAVTSALPIAGPFSSFATHLEKSLSSLSAATPDGLKNKGINEILSTHSRMVLPGQQEKKDGRCPPEPSEDCEKNLIALIKQLEYAHWKFNLLTQMVNDYFDLPTPGQLSFYKNPAYLYSTYTLETRDSAKPYTNNYKITDSLQKQTRTRNFSVGREKWVIVSGGIFVNQSLVRQVYVDTAGHEFKITNTESRSKFVMGIQFYPFKSFAGDDRLVPRFFLKRISIFGGFELLKPLDNLYAGIAYDIVPGLTGHFGKHIYKYDEFKVQNNQIVGQTSSYQVSGNYFGISADPALLVSLLVNLFK
jgi:hypothetical protein